MQKKGQCLLALSFFLLLPNGIFSAGFIVMSPIEALPPVFISIICLSIGGRKTSKQRFSPPPFVTSVHKDIAERLPRLNRSLYLQAKEVLDENKAQRHIRGGLATKRKYQHQ